MKRKVRWGILGVARIAVNRVVPAMLQSEWSEVAGLASRDHGKAREAARRLGIPKAYGAYQELLDDPEIEAVYNPLPNHLHVPWTIRAAEAGKHVLCEKPIALSAEEALRLEEVSRRCGVKIEEAFMVRSHPQWLKTRDLIQAGTLGRLRAIRGIFTYFNRDPNNVRNVREYGGGALLDIGCYPVTLSRFIYQEEPLRVQALLERDPVWEVDRLVSAQMEFPSGHSSFLCSTQLAYFQRMEFYGTEARLELETPFNPPLDSPARLKLDRGRDPQGRVEIIEIPAANQFTIQADLFSQAVRGEGPVAIPLSDSIQNMAVIDALFRSAETGRWQKPKPTEDKKSIK